MRNSRMDELHAGIKVNNPRYLDDVILMADNEEELKNL